MLKLNGHEIERRKFPDGTPLLKLPPDIVELHRDNTILWLYDDMGEITDLSFIARKIRDDFPGVRLVVNPYTRDTFSVTIKATYGVVDGREIEIFKDPATDRAAGHNFKKSQRGLCHVFQEDGSLAYRDGYTAETLPDGNLLEPVFRDGELLHLQSIWDIRHEMYGEGF